MSFGVTPNERQIYVSLRAALLAMLPAGTPVRQGQINRVPEPAQVDFVVFWPINKTRLTTNMDEFIDAVFTGSIAATVMTITAKDANYPGILEAGSGVFGTGVTDGTKVVAQLTGTPGGIGTYTITPSQTVASRTLSAGVATLEQDTNFLVQIDVHGPNSGDNSQTISTILRDQIGVDYFSAANVAQGFAPNIVCPFYADDPRQGPFINEAQQFENRYIVEVRLQANQTLKVPLQFSDVLDITLIPLE